jgi:secreted trypsin-like serine protease
MKAQGQQDSSDHSAAQVSTSSVTRRTALVAFAAAAMLSGLVGCGNPSASSSAGRAPASVDNVSGIIGGDVAAGSEDFVKSTVMLYDAVQQSLCTASIISKDMLLTAAHCVDDSPKALKVIFLLSLDKLSKDNVQTSVRQVTDFRTNPLWATNQDEEKNTGDLAVVKFAGGLPDGYSPVGLLNKSADIANTVTVLLAGYGTSDGVAGTGAGLLRSVETTVLDASFSASEFLVKQDAGKGACHGDSGGPAFIRIGDRLAVAGLTSRGVNDPKNQCNVSAAYTSVPHYLTWIKATAKMLEAAPLPAAPAPATAATTPAAATDSQVVANH